MKTWAFSILAMQTSAGTVYSKKPLASNSQAAFLLPKDGASPDTASDSRSPVCVSSQDVVKWVAKSEYSKPRKENLHD